MVISKVRSIFSIATGLALMTASVTATAQTGAAFPSRAISMVVPYAPGGVTDVVARMIATSLSKELGQSIIVENVAGGRGNVAATKLTNASPDGHTLFECLTEIRI